MPSNQNEPASQDSPSMSCGMHQMIRTSPSLSSWPLHMPIDEGSHFCHPSTASVHNQPGTVDLHSGGGQRVLNSADVELVVMACDGGVLGWQARNEWGLLD
jgi:hypothetical protein